MHAGVVVLETHPSRASPESALRDPIKKKRLSYTTRLPHPMTLFCCFCFARDSNKLFSPTSVFTK